MVNPMHIDSDGHTLMHWAAKRGDYDSVHYLAEKGAPMFLSSGDGVGMQPIHWAITDGHLPILHYLVSRVSKQVYALS
jgi:palmitoyltransferase ZDHHC13/17